MSKQEFTTNDQLSVVIDETPLYCWLSKHDHADLKHHSRLTKIESYLHEAGFEQHVHFISESSLEKMAVVYDFYLESAAI